MYLEFLSQRDSQETSIMVSKYFYLPGSSTVVKGWKRTERFAGSASFSTRPATKCWPKWIMSTRPLPRAACIYRPHLWHLVVFKVSLAFIFISWPSSSSKTTFLDFLGHNIWFGYDSLVSAELKKTNPVDNNSG